MSAKWTLNERPTARRPVAANTGVQVLGDPERDAPEALAPTDREAATQPPAAGPPARPDTASGSAAERDKRRRQRAIEREGHGAAKAGERLHQSKTRPMGTSLPGRLVLGETVSVGLIGIVAVGLIVGAILGGLGAPGWVIGLLVATLTVILSTVLRRSPRQR
ncbi:MAG: hypothetical protein WBP81_05215 [Solirubrobacteraceae bacterium]